MKSIKTIFLLPISVFLAIVLSCCASPNEYDPNKYDFEHDDQYYCLKLSASLPSIAESEHGYYFFSGENNSFLYYMDKETLKPTVLCNKPDCLHSDEPDGNKRANCNAYFFSCNNLIYYNKNLYAIGDDTKSFSTYLLYQISLDGTSRKVIYKFNDVVQRLIIHRGYIYYAIDDFGTISGNEYSTESTCRIYRINIDKIGDGPELVFEGKGIGGIVGYMAGYRNNIYFIYLKYADSTLETMNSYLYKYSTNGNNLDMIKENVGDFTFYNDRIICADINKNLVSCDLNGTDAVTMNGIIGSPVVVDHNYIYILDWDLSGYKFAIYDWGGNIVKDFDRAIAKCMLYGGDDRYFFLEDEYSHNEFGNIHTIYMIDKSKLPTSAEPIKVFEYVPKVQYSGMVAPEG
jgi:hypothetical protein